MKIIVVQHILAISFINPGQELPNPLFIDQALQFERIDGMNNQEGQHVVAPNIFAEAEYIVLQSLCSLKIFFKFGPLTLALPLFLHQEL